MAHSESDIIAVPGNKHLEWLDLPETSTGRELDYGYKCYYIVMCFS